MKMALQAANLGFGGAFNIITNAADFAKRFDKNLLSLEVSIGEATLVCQGNIATKCSVQHR
jgi:hypothetical protein